MKHSGKARQAAFKMIFWTLVALGVIFVAAIVATMLGTFIAIISTFLVGIWVLFALFTLYFFRDPNATVPIGANLVVSPSHGTVDAIGEVEELTFMGGKCQRISIFLNVFNVHVQNAPVSGKIGYYKYTTGQFLSATRSDCADCNENLLFG